MCGPLLRGSRMLSRANHPQAKGPFSPCYRMARARYACAARNGVLVRQGFSLIQTFEKLVAKCLVSAVLSPPNKVADSLQDSGEKIEAGVTFNISFNGTFLRRQRSQSPLKCVL